MTVEIWGHRGARGLFPENTIEGIIGALAWGVDRVEVDVALTADRVPVLSHAPFLSPDLARGPDGAWVNGPRRLIRHMTAAELASFDVGRIRPGSATAAAFSDQSPRDGAQIPTLTQALALDCRLAIEMKTFPDHPDEASCPELMAEAVAEVVRSAGAWDRIILQSFDWRGLRHARRIFPNVHLAWLTCARNERCARLWWDGASPADFGGSVPRAIAAQGGGRGGIWAPEHESLTRARLAEARTLGLRVVPWTVNEPADFARLAEWGVNGVITDRPDLARAAMVRAGRSLIAPSQ